MLKISSSHFCQVPFLFIFLIIGLNVATAQTDSTIRFSFKPYIIPTTLMTTGLLTQGQISKNIQTEVLKKYPHFESELDDYLQYAPTLIPLAMGAVGIAGRHKFKDQIVLSILSHGIAQAVAQSLKYIVTYPRPDGVGMESFPSGHTTGAFTGAAFMHKEYGPKSVVYSILGYGMAATVGTYRILQNRHWFADVAFGAGVGIAATQTAYLVYPWLQKKVFKNKNYAVLPTYNSGAVGLYAVKIL